MRHAPPHAFQELHRLEALQALGLLDAKPDRAFDALAALAARLLRCPIGLFSLIDDQRLWVKASVGLALEHAPRSEAFCDHTIGADDPLIVPDASIDPRFATNVHVVADDGIRFYAGAPLRARHPVTGASYRVGTICALDRVGRAASPADREALAHLGTLAEALLAARTQSVEAMEAAVAATEQAVALRRSDLTFRQAERMAAIGSWRYEIATERLTWSDGVSRIHELPIGFMPALDAALDFYPDEARGEVAASFAHAVETGAAFSFETDFVTAGGNLRRVRSMGEGEIEGGRVAAVTGVFQDVTDRYRLEQELRRSAATDGLTGLANRVAFDRALEAAMADAGADAGTRPLMLVLVDLDFFKQLNDRFGHAAGDDVLRATGERLHAPWLAGSHAARLGGDEFALIVRDPALCAEGDLLARRLLASLGAPVVRPDAALPSAATVGYATFDPALHLSTRAFLHSADCALYEAKRAGRGSARRFAPAGRRASDGAAVRAAA